MLFRSLTLFINFDHYKNFKIPIGGNGGSIAIGNFINNRIGKYATMIGGIFLILIAIVHIL